MRKHCKNLIGICVLLLAMILVIPTNVYAADDAEAVENSELKGNADWKWPVPEAKSISSCYLDGRDHYAIDIWARQGAEVYACFEGEVIEVVTSCTHNYGKSYGCGCNGNLGNSVSIHHTYNGVDYVSRYGHLTSVEVSEGDIVTMDTLIGTVGSTGYSGNHHLDLRIYQGSTVSEDRHEACVDPLLDLFLEIPEGINASKASTGCCYSYMREVLDVYEEVQARKEAERIAAEKARQEQAEKEAFEEAMRDWVENELLCHKNCLGVKLPEVQLELQDFINHYK